MSNIWKFYHNTGTIDTIYIFVGDLLYTYNIELQAIKTMYINDRENPVIKKIFLTQEELEKITRNNINVEFIDDTIYPDDSVETVKFKLLIAIREFMGSTSFEELYLYGFTEYKIDKLLVYNKLTNNNRIELDKTRLIDFLNNIGKSELIERLSIQDKQVYNLDDFYDIPLEPDSVTKVAIGQRFILDRKEITYSLDPFTTIKIDPVLEQNARDIISTTNKNLLFEYDIVNNVIYFSSLQDIEGIASPEIPISSLIKTYFPYLYNDGIEDLEAFNLVKSKYYSRTEKMIESASFKQYNASISLFNRLSSDELVSYNKIGLKTVELKIHPEIPFNFPIDTVFRLINSSRDKPMIKYNPGKGQENIYRLYTERRSSSGKKIPLMKRTLIFQLMKTIGMRKSVTIYCYGETTNKTPMFIQFNPDGMINVRIINNRPISLSILQQLINDNVNPILQVLQDRLENTGYKFTLFKSILDKNVEVVNLQYYSEIEISKNINLTSIKSCISNVFNIQNYNLSSGGISMRYKRVSNYNEMNSIDSSIVELIKLEYRESDIVKNIVDNYKISEESAIEKITSVVNNLQLVQNLYRSRSIKIKNNPGFQTTIERDRFKNRILIDVQNIDHFEYIDNITRFIDSIIRISQQISIGERESSMISQLCRNRAIKTERFIEDIIGQNEAELKDDEDEPADAYLEEGREIMFDDDPIEDTESIGSDMMDFFMDEELDEESDGREIGGAIEDELNDITGKNIANPTPFFKKLREHEPTLFLTENDSKFKSYSRICPSNIKRQPVLLTDSEKDTIDRDHAGSYDRAIKYGSSPDNQYWYICPRYWSLKDGVSLTQEQVDSGNYGTIIPQDAKVVPPGGNIYEFNSSYHQDSKGDYKGLHPGFMEDSKHPDGKCIPCCFKTWDTPTQLKRRKACESGKKSDPKQYLKKDVEKTKRDKDVEEGDLKGDLEEGHLKDLEDLEEGDLKKEDLEDLKKPDLKQQERGDEPKRLDEYIKGPEKFPLETTKWGYIPVAIQTLLNSDMRKCYISKLNTNLKPFVPCLLRRGIGQDAKTSFVSSIADVFRESMTSDQLLQLIISTITIDNFARYNNGNLVSLFKNIDNQVDNKRDSIDISQFSDSKIYNNIDITNTRHTEYLKTVIKSYNNYITFLNDKNAVIDHTYLWDVICRPDKNLFIQGVNIIIFDITQTDSTENVNILCPTTHYSDRFFDPDKKTILLVKKDKYYEPIYAVEDTKLKFSVTKLFNLKNRDFLPDLKKILTTISRSLQDKCADKPSVRIIDLKKNISLVSIINIVTTLKFEIDYQVIDYNNKVIGIYITRDDVYGYLPTYPSAIYDDFEIPIKFMDDVEWNDYSVTRIFLDTIYFESNNRIACSPRVKIIEDKMIVGILTNGNQFVKLAEPEVDNGDDLVSQEDRDYIAADLIIQNMEFNNNDKRVSTIRNIELEESFYKMFRNILRNNLGKREYLDSKNRIIEIIEDKSALYLQKLREIDEIVRDVMETSVIFSKMSELVLANIRDLVNCNKRNKDCENLDYCMATEEKECVQIIPITNLINGLNNEELYYAKISDELIRYKKIKQFIIDSDKYLSLSKIEYDIRDNEIFIIQTMLNHKFFEGLVAVHENQYVRNRVYDGVNPEKTDRFYSNEVNLDDIEKDEYEMEGQDENILDITDSGCSLTKKQLIGYLQQRFPPKTFEIYYKTPQSICSYEIMMNIMKDYDPQFARLSIHDIKKQMVDVYRQYTEDIKILIILLIELNKKVVLERVLDNAISMDEMLLSDEYYLTYLDMILLSKYYNLPIILISSMPIMEKMSPDTIIIPNKMHTDKWYFIKVPSIVTRVKKNDYPIYKLLTYLGDLKIGVDQIARDLREDIERHLADPRDILTFLIDNIKPKKKYRLKLIDKIKTVPNRRFKIIE